MTRFSAFVILVAAGVSGAVVMIVEVAGAHVLAPGFGTGLNAWAAMITVALGALGLGYALGGLAADRWKKHTARILAGTLACGGIFCVADALIWDELVRHLAGLGPRLGAVATASALFVLPFVFLGAACPLTIKSWTRRIEEVGRRSGFVSAVSAVGSLTGAALAGFVLVPELSLELIFACCAVALLATAGAVLLACRGGKAAGVVLLALALAPLVLPARPAPDGLLLRRGSMFGQLEVWQSGIMRRMGVAGVCQAFARYDADSGEPPVSNMPHIRMISTMLADSLPVENEDVLIIGLGAGFMPRQLLDDEIPSLTVEIDSAVVEAAEQFFAFDRKLYPVAVADGRAFLLTRDSQYGAVVIDALRGIDLPYHLLTKEFFTLVRSRLVPGGILVVNYHGFMDGEQDKLLRSIEKTLRAVFGSVDICLREERLMTEQPRERLTATYGNVIFAAHQPDAKVCWPQGVGHEDIDTFQDARPAVVLTDSPNPVALWCAQMEQLRRKMEKLY